MRRTCSECTRHRPASCTHLLCDIQLVTASASSRSWLPSLTAGPARCCSSDHSWGLRPFHQAAAASATAWRTAASVPPVLLCYHTNAASSIIFTGLWDMPGSFATAQGHRLPPARGQERYVVERWRRVNQDWFRTLASIHRTLPDEPGPDRRVARSDILKAVDYSGMNAARTTTQPVQR
jgi:hypothetical protein